MRRDSASRTSLAARGFTLVVTVIALMATTVFIQAAETHSVSGAAHAIALAEQDVAAPVNEHDHDDDPLGNHEHSEIDEDSAMGIRPADLAADPIVALPANLFTVTPQPPQRAITLRHAAGPALAPSLIAMSINRT